MKRRWTTTSSGDRALPASALSVVVHVVLIAAAVVATADTDGRTAVPEINVIARFLAPPDRAGQAAQREMVKFVAIGDRGTLALADRLKLVEVPKPEPETKASGVDELDAPPRPQLAGQDSVFTELEVDSAARRYTWSAAPAYPKVMLDAKREGYVKAEWIVDESGYADTTTFRLVDYTSNEFAKAVRDALPFMRFSPAKFGAKPVKQLVQQEFTFRITNLMTDAKKPPEFLEF